MCKLHMYIQCAHCTCLYIPIIIIHYKRIYTYLPIRRNIHRWHVFNREFVLCVGNQETRFAHGSVPHDYTLDRVHAEGGLKPKIFGSFTRRLVEV